MFQPDQAAAACALWHGMTWRAGHFTFRAAPGGDAETDADQQCSSAAEATPGPGVMRKGPARRPFPSTAIPHDTELEGCASRARG
jgi:hypothetical protein